MKGPIPVVLLESNFLRPALRRLDLRIYLETMISMVPRPGKLIRGTISLEGNGEDASKGGGPRPGGAGALPVYYCLRRAGASAPGTDG